MFFDPPLLTFLSIVVVSVTSLGFVEARRRKKNAVASEALIGQLEKEVVRTRQDGERKLVKADDVRRSQFDGLETEKQVLEGTLAESERLKRFHYERVKELLGEKIVRLAEHAVLKKERDTAIEQLHTSEGQMMVLRHRRHGYRRRAYRNMGL